MLFLLSCLAFTEPATKKWVELSWQPWSWSWNGNKAVFNVIFFWIVNSFRSFLCQFEVISPLTAMHSYQLHASVSPLARSRIRLLVELTNETPKWVGDKHQMASGLLFLFSFLGINVCSCICFMFKTPFFSTDSCFIESHFLKERKKERKKKNTSQKPSYLKKIFFLLRSSW